MVNDLLFKRQTVKTIRPCQKTVDLAFVVPGAWNWGS